MIGGHGETHLLRVVAGYADICNIGFEMSLEEHQAKMEILKRHCDGFGRDPAEIEVTHNTRVAIGETQREFEALAAQAAANTNVSLRAYKDSLSRAISGTPERCIQPYMSFSGEGYRWISG